MLKMDTVFDSTVFLLITKSSIIQSIDQDRNLLSVYIKTQVQTRECVYLPTVIKNGKKPNMVLESGLSGVGMAKRFLSSFCHVLISTVTWRKLTFHNICHRQAKLCCQCLVIVIFVMSRLVISQLLSFSIKTLLSLWLSSLFVMTIDVCQILSSTCHDVIIRYFGSYFCMNFATYQSYSIAQSLSR